MGLSARRSRGRSGYAHRVHKGLADWLLIALYRGQLCPGGRGIREIAAAAWLGKRPKCLQSDGWQPTSSLSKTCLTSLHAVWSSCLGRLRTAMSVLARSPFGSCFPTVMRNLPPCGYSVYLYRLRLKSAASPVLLITLNKIVAFRYLKWPT